MRVGFGYDAHRLVAGRQLVLGGAEISYNLGLLGHSDADVLTHAIIDAILGAAGLGDIGRMFPDTDIRYKDIKSLELLKHAYNAVLCRGYRVVNIDSVVVAQNPKLSPYIGEMEKNIAECLNIQTDDRIINIKATTEEGMGFTGSGEGISATAVCVLMKE